MGQFFQFFDAPNRFGLPPFYTLHVWAWKDNPIGAFVNWHPPYIATRFLGPRTDPFSWAGVTEGSRHRLSRKHFEFRTASCKPL